MAADVRGCSADAADPAGRAARSTGRSGRVASATCPGRGRTAGRANVPASGRASVLAAALALAVALGLGLAGGGDARAALPIALPTPLGFVSDFAGIIDPGTRTELDRLNENLRRATGAEIAVVTVRSTQPDDAFDYAVALFEKWKPGSREKDNGVLFLVAVDDRKMQVITGYGVEGVLPDGRVGQIRDRVVVPAFRAGRYADGIREAVTEMARLIAADAGASLDGVPAARRPAAGSGLVSLIFSLLLLLFLLVLLQALSQAMHGAQGRGARRGPRIGSMGGGFGGGFGGSSGGFGGFGGGETGGGGAGGSW